MNWRILTVIVIAAFSIVILVQFQTTRGLRAELSVAREENARLQQQADSASGLASGTSNLRADSNQLANLTEPQQKRLQDLEGEVMRLRGSASRAIRAEAEVDQLKAQLAGHQNSALSAAAAPEASPASAALITYLGDSVPAPANIDPAYTKEGLIDAIRRAAQAAGVSVKRVEIETSEFPFIAGVVCESDAEFEKIKAQFRTMHNYQYGGATSSHGTYAFNITPYQAYPSEAGQRISRRTILRQQMFFDQLNSSGN